MASGGDSGECSPGDTFSRIDGSPAKTGTGGVGVGIGDIGGGICVGISDSVRRAQGGIDRAIMTTWPAFR